MGSGWVRFRVWGEGVLYRGVRLGKGKIVTVVPVDPRAYVRHWPTYCHPSISTPGPIFRSVPVVVWSPILQSTPFQFVFA